MPIYYPPKTDARRAVQNRDSNTGNSKQKDILRLVTLFLLCVGFLLTTYRCLRSLLSDKSQDSEFQYHLASSTLVSIVASTLQTCVRNSFISENSKAPNYFQCPSSLGIQVQQLDGLGIIIELHSMEESSSHLAPSDILKLTVLTPSSMFFKCHYLVDEDRVIHKEEEVVHDQRYSSYRERRQVVLSGVGSAADNPDREHHPPCSPPLVGQPASVKATKEVNAEAGNKAKVVVGAAVIVYPSETFWQRVISPPLSPSSTPHSLATSARAVVNSKQEAQNEGPALALVMLAAIVAFLYYNFACDKELSDKQNELDTKRKFMRFVSHEVRTPLNTVKLGLHVMQVEISNLSQYILAINPAACPTSNAPTLPPPISTSSPLLSSAARGLAAVNVPAVSPRSFSAMAAARAAARATSAKALLEASDDDYSTINTGGDPGASAAASSLPPKSSTTITDADLNAGIVGGSGGSGDAEAAADLYLGCGKDELKGDTPSSPAYAGHDHVHGNPLQTVEDALDGWMDLSQDVLGNSEIAVLILDDLLHFDKLDSGTLRLEVDSVPVSDLLRSTCNQFRLSALSKGVDLLRSITSCASNGAGNNTTLAMLHEQYREEEEEKKQQRQQQQSDEKRGEEEEEEDDCPQNRKSSDSSANIVAESTNITLLSEFGDRFDAYDGESTPIDSERLIVVGDNSRLAQVLRNFISNALKFTPKGGRITIQDYWNPEGLKENTDEIEASRPRSISAAVSSAAAAAAKAAAKAATRALTEVVRTQTESESKNQSQEVEAEVELSESEQRRQLVSAQGLMRAGSIVITVTDTGVGLPEEKLQRTFGEGVQFDAGKLQAGGGSGLGLFIAKGLIEQHGGRVWVASDGPGQGCSFSLELPTYLQQQQFSPQPDYEDSLLDEGRGSMGNKAGQEAGAVINTHQEQGGHMTPREGSPRTTCSHSSRQSRSGSRSPRHARSGSDHATHLSQPQSHSHSRALSSATAGLGSHAPSSSSMLNRCLSSDSSSDSSSARATSSISAISFRSKASSFSDMFKHVLIVDDAASNRKMLVRLLTSKGYICREAQDGKDALRVYSSIIEAGGVVDTILMDYEMPEMDGPTATRELRTKLSCTCLIFGVTGNVLPKDVEHFKQQGANKVLAKPLKLDMLEQSWREHSTGGGSSAKVGAASSEVEVER